MGGVGFEVDGIYVSAHAVKRMRQRLGIPKRAVAREVSRVLRDGLRAEQTTGRLRRRVDAIRHKQSVMMGKGTVVLTGGAAFIFRGSALVTVLLLDGETSKLVRRAIEK